MEGRHRGGKKAGLCSLWIDLVVLTPPRQAPWCLEDWGVGEGAVMDFSLTSFLPLAEVKVNGKEDAEAFLGFERKSKGNTVPSL